MLELEFTGFIDTWVSLGTIVIGGASLSFLEGGPQGQLAWGCPPLVGCGGSSFIAGCGSSGPMCRQTVLGGARSTCSPVHTLLPCRGLPVGFRCGPDASLGCCARDMHQYIKVGASLVIILHATIARPATYHGKITMRVSPCHCDIGHTSTFSMKTQSLNSLRTYDIRTYTVLYITVKRLKTGNRINQVSTIAHPIPNQMGSNLGGILYMNGSCLNKPQMGQDGLLDSQDPGKCLGSWCRFE